MLTIVKSPPEYNLAKSPMICKLSVNNLWYTSNIGDKAYCSYTWTGAPLVGDTFVIAWATGSVTFTFATTLNPLTNLNLRTNVGGLSSTAYTAQVVADILTNPTIAGLFDVTNDQYIILIKAKNAGTAYTFSNGLGSAYADFYNLKNGSDNIVSLQHENYGVMVDIILFDDFLASTYKTIYTTFKKFATSEPVATCDLEFDVSKIINSQLDYDLPAPGTSLAFMCDKVIRRFFLRYREFYGDPPVPQFNGIGPISKLIYTIGAGYPEGYTVTGYALKAGFSQKKSRIIDDKQFDNYYHPNYFVIPNHESIFLTRQPRVKKIKRNQPEYLYLIIPYDIPSDVVCLSVQGYDKFGNNIAGTFQSITVPGLLKNMVWCLPVNFPGSYIESDNAAYYKVHAALGSTPRSPISEIFTYIIDDQYSIDEKFLLFTNSDGGFDSLCIKGKIAKGTEYTKEEYTRDFKLSDADQVGEISTTEASEVESYTASTGFITKESKEWLRDLFLAKTVVEWDGINQRFIPVVINTRKISISESQQNLFSLSFEYSHAFNQLANDKLNYLK